jgi:hypothetical protein
MNDELMRLFSTHSRLIHVDKPEILLIFHFSTTYFLRHIIQKDRIKPVNRCPNGENVYEYETVRILLSRINLSEWSGRITILEKIELKIIIFKIKLCRAIHQSIFLVVPTSDSLSSSHPSTLTQKHLKW